MRFTGLPRRQRPQNALVAILAMSLLVAACGRAVSTGDLQSPCVVSGGKVTPEDETVCAAILENPPAPKPSFVLTDTSGEAYDFATRTEGKLTLLYFGYLNCPDICPVHLAQIAEVFDTLPDVARDAEVVFVSVDPGRDTPEAIRSFLDNFDTRFVGLTGTPEELAVAQSAAGVPVAELVGEGSDYTVGHAGWVIAYAPDGLNYAIYPFGVRQSEWANDLQILAALTGEEGE